MDDYYTMERERDPAHQERTRLRLEDEAYEIIRETYDYPVGAYIRISAAEDTFIVYGTGDDWVVECAAGGDEQKCTECYVINTLVKHLERKSTIDVLYDASDGEN